MWRQVTEEEMERKMRGKKIEVITRAEIQRVTDILRKSGREVDIVEFKINAKTLEIGLFNEVVGSVCGRRFDRPTRPKTLRRHWLQSDTKKVWYPRIAPNNLHIETFGDNIPYFEIFKCDDDYFWVGSSDDDYFICDGIQGLLSMLADHLMPEENKSNP
jgi:hypothetical protein